MSANTPCARGSLIGKRGEEMSGCAATAPILSDFVACVAQGVIARERRRIAHAAR